jgi:hypothetical protein
VAKVFIFGIGGLIAIGLISLGIFMVSGASRLSLAMFKKKNKEEKS